MTIKANNDASFDGRQTTDTEFRLTADYFNAALRAAEVQGVTVSIKPDGDIWLDASDLEYPEIVNRLLHGLVLLHTSA